MSNIAGPLNKTITYPSNSQPSLLLLAFSSPSSIEGFLKLKDVISLCPILGKGDVLIGLYLFLYIKNTNAQIHSSYSVFLVCSIGIVTTIAIVFFFFFFLIFIWASIYILILIQQISQYFHNYWGVNFL